MKSIPKTGDLLCPEYLAFVRTLPCCFCGADPPVDAHHVKRRGSGIQDDTTAISACRECHSRDNAPRAVEWLKVDRTRSVAIEIGGPKLLRALADAIEKRQAAVVF